MHIVLLRFSTNKSQAGKFMEGHKTWLKRGFDDGVFLLAGSLEPELGGRNSGSQHVVCRLGSPGE